MKRPLLALAAACLTASAPLFGATINIVNVNTAGVGFNDTTSVTPVGGNPGVTLGDQRLNCFKEAARIWGGLLSSDVTINIESSFESLTCNSTSAVLGAAGAISVDADFPGAEFPSTWYAIALASKLAKADLDPSGNDIKARFNSRLGAAGCAFKWYYGLDGNHGNDVDLVTVLLHEFGHGLGFATFANGSTGILFQGQPDIFNHYIFDDTARLTWPEMSSDGDRQASAINTGKLTFNGAATKAYGASHLSKRPRLKVTSPSGAAGTYAVGTASFGPALTGSGISGTLVAAEDPGDASGGSTTDGCSTLTNASAVSGKIALIDRGSCNFTVKVKNAQNAGAIAVIIADNQDGSPPPGLGGTDATITIPAVRVTQNDGATLRANLPATVNLGLDDTLLSGADDAGNLLLYAPNPYESGSSVSHFDTSATPDLLMEPIINGDLTHGVDATLETFRDIGWFRGDAGGGGTTTWFLPSSAHASGANGAFYTTDITIANRGSSMASFTLKFLGHDQDGRGGAEKSFTLAAGKAVTYADVLGSVFSVASGFGAIRITSDSAALKIVSQTSTPGAGGTFGQSVPVSGGADLVAAGTPKAIGAAREDASFRTNLVLVNTTEASLDVDVTVLGDDGSMLGTAHYTGFQPLEMRQISRVLQSITGSSNLKNATLVLSTPTAGGAFAAYASVIDNVTNDPRTLLASGGGTATTWFLPSSAHASGANGAFYTTDVTIANRGASTASYTLKFLGHDQDGRTGAEKTFTLAAGKAVTYADVLGSVFSVTSGFGAIRITSDSPALKIVSQTSTPGAGGTFGQSVPVSSGAELIAAGTSKAVGAAREDASFRTNLVLVNTTETTLDIDVTVLADDGTMLGTGRYGGFGPFEMRQVSRVLQAVTGSSDLKNATLVLSTATPGGAFASYASVIDNATNDPRTLLP